MLSVLQTQRAVPQTILPVKQRENKTISKKLLS